MNPIQISNDLKQTLVDYLTTTFDVNRDGQEPDLADMIRAELDASGALFNGPYLELTPPYTTGCTLHELIDEGVLSKKLRTMPCFQAGRPIPLGASLYTHQESSIRRLLHESRSIVVSSGTGSGKTECFLIPILNDLLSDNTPGVRALLIYPMNALVNDQLDRLRSLLKDTDITFGRYTSELEQTEKQARAKLGVEPLPNEVICRDDIQSARKIPQILITNYAMLEYLLLRPEDSTLFKQGLWKFLVLDEAHTYAGAQGVEVAMLIRRLKHRLGKTPGDMRCIATSATLTTDEADAAADFAANLFHEPITAEDVIFGEIDLHFAPPSDKLHQCQLEVYQTTEVAEIIQRAHELDAASRQSIADLCYKSGLSLAVPPTTPNHPLWDVMKDDANLIRLRNWMMEHPARPARPADAAEHVFRGQSDEQSRLEALYRLIELGALARPSDDQPPLLPARYHLFARAPQGIWVCINPQCSSREATEGANWSRLFSHRTETCDACGSKAYPLVVCRECGQVYLQMKQDGLEFLPAESSSPADDDTRYFTWKSLDINASLGADLDEDDRNALLVEDNPFQQSLVVLCTRCGSQSSRCTCKDPQHATLHLVEKQETKKVRGRAPDIRAVPLTFMRQCPRCYSASIPNTEIVTPITVAGTTPLSTITYELYRHLPPSPKPEAAQHPGGGRKLLTFYDSRQGAARFASFLQDTVNQQNYRHIIPRAIQQSEQTKQYAPDFKQLTEQCMTLARDLGIFFNDPDTNIWRKRVTSFSRAERERLTQRTAAEVIAEFTTRRNERQSLETIGLVAVAYFEDEQDAIERIAPLANAIQFTPQQALTLVKYLLDDLRKKKIVGLPEGINADDPVFGKHRFSPRLIRGGSPQAHEESWLGKTERKSRRRLIKQVLESVQRPATERDVEAVLTHILNWLLDETELFEGRPSDGYQLNLDHLFFSTQSKWFRCTNCLRLSPHGTELICPHPACTGKLEPFEPEGRPTFYTQLFQREIIPLRVEEHTAQLDSIKGHEYQDEFRDGRINILSCSTTFEMGIDLGDLQAVALSNVPPTVANYRQRAGRAGRRTGGAAFILTWAADRPHDQTYFRAPGEIISGAVRAPYIALGNEHIRRRHISAILLSKFLRYRAASGQTELGRVGAFFDTQTNAGPHYAAIDNWLNNRRTDILAVLAAFAPMIGADATVESLDQWIKTFQIEIDKVKDKYDSISGYYLQQLEMANRQRKIGDIKTNQTIRDEEEFFERLLKRLREESLINFLSDRGTLPSYSFPLYTVELQLPAKLNAEHLRLQRDLRQAIREYAPGSEIVADKRIWRSGGLQFYGQAPQARAYQICHKCGHLRWSSDVGLPLPDNGGNCEVCQTPFDLTSLKVHTFITPDGFKADASKSGTPAKQYVASNRGQERSALIPSQSPNEEQFGHSRIYYDYQRTGKLLYVNEGKGGHGYTICMLCGSMIGKERRCNGWYRGEKCPGERQKPVALGHVQTTDTLQLRFKSAPNAPVPGGDNRSFWLSLMYALIHGASRALQIERRDINGVLHPRRGADGAWEQTIVLYDDVPGGAGHVFQISRNLPQVIDAALLVLNCTDCQPNTSCTHCLRDYSNQYYYDDLRRHEALRFLDQIRHDLSTHPDATVGAVTANNLPYWLFRQIWNIKQDVYLAASALQDEKPFGASRSWLDVLNDLLNQHKNIYLLLPRFSIQADAPDLLYLAKRLDILMSRGLVLQWCEQLPDWNVILDPSDAMHQRAIRVAPKNKFELNTYAGEAGLETTVDSATIVAALSQFHAASATPATRADLAIPSNTTVRLIERHERNITDATLFGAVFARPVSRIEIRDPYLYDAHRITTRLSSILALARAGGTLADVVVYTKRAGKSGGTGNAQDQDRLFAALEKKLGIAIRRDYDPKKIEHDRSINIVRTDGTRARILIGRGLDFIREDGSIDPTYIVTQELGK